MSQYPISSACPHCGSADYWKRRSSRECRVCRTHYRPPTPLWRRRTIGLGLIVAGLLLGVATAVFVVEVESIISAGRGPGAAADPSGSVCLGVPSVFAIVGLVLLVRRGFKELAAREVVIPPGASLTSGAQVSAPTILMIPAGQAEALVRQVALQHNESAILRQLDPLRPERLAGPVTLFPDGLFFVVSMSRRSTPSERLANAVRSFAGEWDSEETPLLFLDTSWQRNGRAGILVSNRRLYSSRLNGPIELQDVIRAAFKGPSEAELLFKVLLFAACLLVGVIFILWGRWFARRLVVNGEVVYEGRRNIHPAFLVDVLVALGDAARQGEEPAIGRPVPEPPAPQGITRQVGWPTDSERDARVGLARRQGVAALEILPHSVEGVPLGAELVGAPTWEHVERSIRGLDGHAHPLVRLWAERPWEPPGLEIIGGGGKYTLREVGDGWVYYDANGADEEVELQTSGAGHRCAGYYVCTNVERVLRIARRFCETGGARDDD